MAKNNNLTDFLTDVANAIREKKGTSDPINPQNFSDEIASIETGGGGGGAVVTAKDVNFRDYDGTLLHSYSKDEFLALSALPQLPTQQGLVCQGWNYNLEDAMEYVAECGKIEVGATYITDDGKTRLYITIAAKGRQDVPLYFSQTVANGVIIDWGDGSATQTLSGTGNKDTTHYYDKIGDYVISLDVADGCMLGLGRGSSYCVMGATGNIGKVYCNMLQRVEIGKNVTSIGDYAFNYCYSLSSIVIPQGVTSIGSYVFSACYSLSSLVIPKGVTDIAIYTFQSCYSLSSLVIPKGVTTFSDSAFHNCYCLSSIVIPKGVTDIATYAFTSCYGMSFYDFAALDAVPTLATTKVFNNIPSDCKIVVPDGLYDSWVAATNWSNYASYIIKISDFNPKL